MLQFFCSVFYFFLLVFFLNILLLNFYIVNNSNLSGLFPRFFHAVILNYLGEDEKVTFLSLIFELSFFLTSGLLLSFIFRFYWKENKILTTLTKKISTLIKKKIHRDIYSLNVPKLVDLFQKK